MPQVGLWNCHELREGARAIYAHAQGVGAEMAATSQAIPAMSTGDVSFNGHQIPFAPTFDVVAELVDDTHEFMSNRHRDRNRLLRPLVPVINMDVGSADGCFQHPNQHIVIANLGN